ncbi:MAG TPA: NADH-ubiquinone oxidoreductase-F iron-sulfur binding region domain-containing protein [Chitinispirillaceae bacterium]|nr:NADH-ubiquinone oxidoreductase-F iron-sulfur binding region domain-containing protein [Chitinispirillaceae bacterium]
MGVLNMFQSIVDEAAERFRNSGWDDKVRIITGSATCENASGAIVVEKKFKSLLSSSKRTDILLKKRGCTGFCSFEPIVTIQHPGTHPFHYRNVTNKLCKDIFDSHVIEGIPVHSALIDMKDESEQSYQDENKQQVSGTSVDGNFREMYGNIAFFKRQSRVALRNCGVIDPENIDDYLLNKGFRAFSSVLGKGDHFFPVNEVNRALLRGRGGAGYPSGKKWIDVANSKDPVKYLICNADEGDPGAFMDRDMLESDPFSVIEGMLIVAYAIGASQGYFYIRSEYPLAIRRVEKALNLCYEKGFTGKDILGSGFSCDIEIRAGAGAFVCGEETALIASIEGNRGWPRIRPPYPSQEGLWGKPTVINNVETLANVPAIIDYGADWFASMGSSKSGGTKVFALSGRVVHTGLVEVPMGTTLKEIVYDIGGGVPDNKSLKAIQTGGPAGGCIPVEKLDIPVDYHTLSEAGSIMGSGGMIVMDETKCMVDTARFFMSFSQDESCGECTPCREGTKRLLEILERITTGKGVPGDIDKLERLCHLLKRASLCGLGRAAPNPVLSTLRYFRDEYEIHINEKRCPAGQCKF